MDKSSDYEVTKPNTPHTDACMAVDFVLDALVSSGAVSRETAVHVRDTWRGLEFGEDVPGAGRPSPATSGEMAAVLHANHKLAGALDMVRETLNGGHVDDLLYIINSALAEHRACAGLDSLEESASVRN